MKAIMTLIATIALSSAALAEGTTAPATTGTPATTEAAAPAPTKMTKRQKMHAAMEACKSEGKTGKAAKKCAKAKAKTM